MATTTKDRQIRRLQEQLAETEATLGDVKRLLVRTEAQRDMAQFDLSEARASHAHELNGERLKRVAAQRGLVAYMKEHGLADRIGYDPDADPVVQQEIAEGRIPPRTDPRVLKEIAATVVAARQA